MEENSLQSRSALCLVDENLQDIVQHKSIFNGYTKPALPLRIHEQMQPVSWENLP